MVDKRGLLAIAAVGLWSLLPARAAVVEVRVLERTSFAEGMNFAGAKLKMRGCQRRDAAEMLVDISGLEKRGHVETLR